MKSNIRIAVSVHVLAAAVKKRINLGFSLYILPPILSLAMLEKMRIHKGFAGGHYKSGQSESYISLNLIPT